MGRGTYGKSADMWSLGVVVFMILTASAPFPEECDVPVGERLRMLQERQDWGSLSQDVRNFLAALLVDEKNRLTAPQALQHPWITGGDFPKPLARPPARPPTALHDVSNQVEKRKLEHLDAPHQQQHNNHHQPA
ncbi:MAP kinase-interacting serine/threonine-protein kinase 1 (MAP kinase signal-integrating kinase 1) (MAPK signal-integrating kinase 1) (Mnk1), partial [Durusdinium trenchii]